MTGAEEDGWEDVALKAGELARGGKPDEGARLLSQVPRGDGPSGSLHETALAWIEIGRAYLSAGRHLELEASIGEAVRAIDRLDLGGTWEPGACRLELANLLAARGDEAGASSLAIRVAEESAPLQGRDVDCLKNVTSSARLLASLGRVEEARRVLGLVTKEEIREAELARWVR